MIARTISGGVLLAVAMTACGAVWAQDATQPPAADAVALLQTQVTALEARILELESTTLAKLKEHNDRLVEKNDTLQLQIDSLKESQRMLVTMSDEQQVQLDLVNEKFEAIAVKDASGYVPSILGNMQKSDEFRNQLLRSVQGKLAINNETGALQQLVINGNEWQVPPGESHVWIPCGNATTHLRSWERDPKQWTMKDWKFKKADADDPGYFELGVTIGMPREYVRR